MSFWDEYTELSGDWIKADELQVLIENGIPVTVTGVLEDDANAYGARYVLQVNVPDPETGEEAPRLKAFPKGTVESRDRMLAQMLGYFARQDAEPVVGKFDQKGRSKLFVKA